MMNDQNFNQDNINRINDPDKNKNDNKEKEMSIADRFITAMFTPSEYNNLLRMKTGKKISYFCVLILLVTIVRFAIPALGMIAGVGGVRNYIINEIPQFSFENGKLDIDELIEEDNSETGAYILVDTEVERFTKDDIPMDRISAILVSRTNMIMYNNGFGANGLVQEQPFSIYGKMKMNNEIVAGYTPLIYIVLAFMLVFMFVLSFVGYLFNGLIYAVFMFLLSKAVGGNLKFGTVYEVSLYAQSVGEIVMAVATCIGSPILILTGSTFGMLVTILIMNKYIFRNVKRRSQRQ